MRRFMILLLPLIMLLPGCALVAGGDPARAMVDDIANKIEQNEAARKVRELCEQIVQPEPADCSTVQPPARGVELKIDTQEGVGGGDTSRSVNPMDTRNVVKRSADPPDIRVQVPGQIPVP